MELDAPLPWWREKDDSRLAEQEMALFNRARKALGA